MSEISGFCCGVEEFFVSFFFFFNFAQRRLVAGYCFMSLAFHVFFVLNQYKLFSLRQN